MIRKLAVAALVLVAVVASARWTDRLHLLAVGAAALVVAVVALVAGALRQRNTLEGLMDDLGDGAATSSMLRDGLWGLILGGLGIALGAAIYSYALPPFYALLVGQCPEVLPKLDIYEEAQAWERAIALIDERLAGPIDRGCRAQLVERKARCLIAWSETLPREQAERKLVEAEQWATGNNLDNYRTIAQLKRASLQPTPGPTLVTPTPPPSPTPRTLATGATAQVSGLDLAYFPPTAFVYLRVADAAGQAIANLAPSDVRVYDDGKPVTGFTLSPFSQAPTPIYAALVIDCSGSMAGEPLAAAKAGAQAFLGLLGARDQVELIGFNDKAQVLQAWTAERQPLGQALDLLEAKDWTALWDALYLAGGDLAGCSGRKVVIVLSDGADNRSQHTREEVIAQARRAGLSVFVIGLRSAEYDGAALQELVGAVGGRYAEATNPAELEQYYRQTAGAIRDEYRLALTLTRQPDGGTHRLRLEVGGPRPIVVEQTYQDPQP